MKSLTCKEVAEKFRKDEEDEGEELVDFFVCENPLTEFQREYVEEYDSFSDVREKFEKWGTIHLFFSKKDNTGAKIICGDEELFMACYRRASKADKERLVEEVHYNSLTNLARNSETAPLMFRSDIILKTQSGEILKILNEKKEMWNHEDYDFEDFFLSEATTLFIEQLVIHLRTWPKAMEWFVSQLKSISALIYRTSVDVYEQLRHLPPFATLPWLDAETSSSFQEAMRNLLFGPGYTKSVLKYAKEMQDAYPHARFFPQKFDENYDMDRLIFMRDHLHVNFAWHDKRIYLYCRDDDVLSFMYNEAAKAAGSPPDFCLVLPENFTLTLTLFELIDFGRIRCRFAKNHDQIFYNFLCGCISIGNVELVRALFAYNRRNQFIDDFVRLSSVFNKVNNPELVQLFFDNLIAFGADTEENYDKMEKSNKLLCTYFSKHLHINRTRKYSLFL